MKGFVCWGNHWPFSQSLMIFSHPSGGRQMAFCECEAEQMATQKFSLLVVVTRVPQAVRASGRLYEVFHFHFKQVTFTDLNIEQHPNCAYDYVEILNGGSASSPSINKYCGNTVPAPAEITSQSNQLRVRFRTDATSAGRGFRLTYRFSSSGTIITIYLALFG